jgi:hypothetical protein
VEIEAERQSLAESLEADEAAVVAAQEALQAHFAALATPTSPEPETPAEQWTEDEMAMFSEGSHEPLSMNTIPRIFSEPDEFSSSRANGAYTED